MLSPGANYERADSSTSHGTTVHWNSIKSSHMNYLSEKRLPGTKKATSTSFGLRPTIACRQRMAVLCDDSIDIHFVSFCSFSRSRGKTLATTKNKHRELKKEILVHEKVSSLKHEHLRENSFRNSSRICVFGQRCFCAKTYYGKNVRHVQKLVHTCMQNARLAEV